MVYYLVHVTTDDNNQTQINVFDGFQKQEGKCTPQFVTPTKWSHDDSVQIRGCAFLEDYPSDILFKLRLRYPGQFDNAVIFSEYEFSEYLRMYPDLVDMLPNL